MPAKPKPCDVNLDHIEINLQPKGQQFLGMLEATGLEVPTVLGYGGARGGAKSATVRRAMLKRRLDHPATVGVIIRRVYSDVKLNHIDTFFRDYPSLQQLYRVVDQEICLPNDSKIKFAYAESLDDIKRKFWGPEFYDAFVDQAEQFTGEELRTIKTANRWPGVAPGSCKMGLFFNPGGVGTAYLRRVFWSLKYEERERASDFAFLQAYGWDNYEWFRGQVAIEEDQFYALPSEYRFELFITQTSYGRELNALPPTQRDGHLLGSFESFAGQYFSGAWDDQKCTVTL